jgi:antiphage defense system Thoeris ThsB-like protein
MAKKIVFISFDYDNDRNYKNLLVAWDKNQEFDFELYDGSLTDAIDSNNAAYIKSKIKPLIERATHLLCIVGTKCGTNKWIEWEVQTAVALKKKLIAVKVEKACVSPTVLLNNGATWALSFNFDAIKKAVDQA